MSMIEVKTSDLIGAALDWSVAKAEHLAAVLTPPNYGNGTSLVYIENTEPLYRPSTNWCLGGWLIEKHQISLIYAFEEYQALIGMTVSEQHESPLVAACRAIVAATLGDSVSLPAELIQP